MAASKGTTGAELKKFLDKRLDIQLNGKRRVIGMLRVEFVSPTEQTPLGTVVIRGNTIQSWECLDKSSLGMSSKKRFIAFFGNLSFSTSAVQVQQFVAQCGLGVDDFQVRLLTKKGSQESRGAAFVEFPTAAGLQTALTLTGKSLDGRTVRIEPTVGGGGRSDTRKQKLKVKKANFKREAVPASSSRI